MSIDFPNIPEIDWQWPDVDPQRLADVLQYDAVNPLLFNTGLFMLLFAAFIGVYALLSRFKYLKMVFVILFSLYFYYKSSAECCFILLGVCVSDYLLGVWLGAARRGWVRKTCVLINVLLNL
ncbi:MAG: MBOAT family protein, partial [Paramuribaculum sp.]|nr:MBOAT family protein [Paramuribaculum sp.]